MKKLFLMMVFCLLTWGLSACEPQPQQPQDTTAQQTADDPSGNDIFDISGQQSESDTDFPNEPESEYTKRY